MIRHKFSTLLLVAAFVLVAALLHPYAALAQPVNDNRADATVISSLPLEEGPVDTRLATLEGDDPRPSCLYWEYAYDHTIWYKYTPEVQTLASLTFSANYPVTAVFYKEEEYGLAEVSCSMGDLYDVSMQAGHTYYLMVAAYGWSEEPYYPAPISGGDLSFLLYGETPPANDNRSEAQEIPGIPFETGTNTKAASIEPDEPIPSCAQYSSPDKTVWYQLNSLETVTLWLRKSAWSFSPFTAVYVAQDNEPLTEVGCSPDVWSNPIVFKAEAGKTYYIQIGGLYGEAGTYDFILDYLPPMEISIVVFPQDPEIPTIYDDINIWANIYDPAYLGVAYCAWDFGDGNTSSDSCDLIHRYAADGDYTVRLEVTTPDGRAASTEQVVMVRTNDVTITRFSLPSNVRVNQTRPIEVYVANPYYPVEVRVELFKSTQTGWEWVGYLQQTIPARTIKKPTKFSFSYTFNQQDLLLGKINFRAVACLVNARDALPVDNEAISLPVTVRK